MPGTDRLMGDSNDVHVQLLTAVGALVLTMKRKNKTIEEL
jgi:hypothetical protein